MASRLPSSALNLKQFMTRREVLNLYRYSQKLVRELPPNQRTEMRTWIREEFERFKNETDPATIKMLISRGHQQMKELESSVLLSK